MTAFAQKSRLFGKTHAAFRVRQLLFSGWISLLLLLPGACSRSEASKQYDHLEAQLTADAMQAISRRNHEVALVKLEQLAELKPANEFIKRLIQREKEQLAMRRIATPVQEGDLDAAWEELRKAEVAVGRPGGIRRRRQQLEALRALAAYTDDLPFKDADTALEAIAQLPKPELLENNAYYRRWYSGQARDARKLQVVQQEEVGAELLDELDQALVTDAPELPAILAQIRALDAASPMVTKRYADPSILGDVGGRVFDLICFLQAIGHDHERQRKILVIFQDRRPFTWAGELLGIWSDLQHKRNRRALNRLRKLQATVPNMRQLPFEPLLQELLKDNAKDLTPTVHGVMQQLYRFQKQ